MSPKVFKSWALTVRPPNGVMEESSLETDILKYIQKQKGGFLCAEKEGHERHLHGQVFFDQAKRKADVKKIIASYQAKYLGLSALPADQSVVLNGGIKIAYNDDFYAEYCQKEDNMIWASMPENSSEYYPPPGEQEKVLAAHSAVDKKYYKYLQLWNDNQPDETVNKRNVAIFLYNLMYVKKEICVIEDPKKRSHLITSLTEYILADPSRALKFMLPEEAKLENEKFKIMEKYTKFLEDNS